MWNRWLRDGLILGIGVGILIVQAVLQFQGKEVSEAMILAAVGLIGGVPFLRAADNGAADDEDDEEADHARP